MKVLTVVGARPQFVKAFAVSRVLGGRHEEVLVHTGQHYDPELSEVFFAELGIPEPDHRLGVGSDTHAAQTADMLRGIAAVVEEEAPDAVVAYGDTNSTLAAAVAAAKLPPPLVHVEAGLRSGDRSAPEEVNRLVTDRVSDLLCAPTETAVANLRREGITDGVVFTGDVMYDALLWACERAPDRTSVLEDLGLAPGEYVLATVHRERNTENPDRLASIVRGLATSPGPVVFPAHPRTTAALRECGLYRTARAAFELVDPVGYLSFVRLVDGADRVVTDSGGVQKEAFFLDTPCITLREETEWPETVDCGANVLVGTDEAAIDRELTGPHRGFDGSDASPFDHPGAGPFGDGDAASEVVDAIETLR